MGKSSRRKKDRKVALQTGRRLVNAEGVLPDVPDEFTYALYQLTNSLVQLRGGEPKQTLSQGQLLVKCEKMALIPLQEYNALIELAGRNNMRQMREVIKAQQAQQAQEGRRIIAPPSGMKI